MTSSEQWSSEKEGRFKIDSNLVRILSVFAFTGVLLVVITIFAAETLSALQSYSILQSHWTEVRNSAMGDLEMYTVTGKESYLQDYRGRMEVLEEMKMVRLEVTGDADVELVKSLLTPFQFSEKEAEAMVMAARWFGGLKEFKQAFNFWERKDRHLAELDRLADQITASRAEASPTGSENQRWLGQIEELDQEITGIHYDISEVLGQGTHRLRATILWSTVGIGLILLLVGGMMTWRFRGSIRKWRRERLQAEQKITDQLKERTVLLEEIHHRVKNNLAFVSSLLVLNEDEIEHPAARQKLKEAQNQIVSIAEIHEIFYDTENFAGLPACKYAERIMGRIFSTFETGEQALEYGLSGDDAVITMNKAIPFGLILNELVTNSCKHAFQAGGRGAVDLQIQSAGGNVRVSYSDNGKGLPDDFDLEDMVASSLGMRLIYTFLKQIEADYKLKTGGKGFRLDFSFAA